MLVVVVVLSSATPLRVKLAEGVNCRFSILTIVPGTTLKSVPGVTEIICACVVKDTNPKRKQSRVNSLFFMICFFNIYFLIGEQKASLLFYVFLKRPNGTNIVGGGLSTVVLVPINYGEIPVPRVAISGLRRSPIITISKTANIS